MPPINGKKYLDQALAQIKQQTTAGKKVAVTFDIDNTLFDTRGRAFAIGKEFDKVNGTTYFKDKTSKQMFVPWFITESRADIAGVQKLETRVKSVLLETRFSGDRKVADETPIWKVDVK